jgi:hypothetical protein
LVQISPINNDDIWTNAVTTKVIVLKVAAMIKDEDKKNLLESENGSDHRVTSLVGQQKRKRKKEHFQQFSFKFYFSCNPRIEILI